MESIIYKKGDLKIVDQLLLPTNLEYVAIRNTLDAWKAIKLMQIRGAPAIAILGGLSIAVELEGKNEFEGKKELVEFVKDRLDHLVTSRPTAVNLANLRLNVLHFLDSHQDLDCKGLKTRLIEELEAYLSRDIECNKSIGKYGSEVICRMVEEPTQLSILTHCNTGSLATAGYGTALGVVRKLHEQGRLENCYFTETRPYNQGSRLTAYELLYENINSTMICDSMVASLMSQRRIHAVVVGADCVACNGDTANKIGTCQMAIVASHFKVPFFVAAPISSINFNIASGDEIKIEERPPKEMTTICGHPTTVEGAKCWNPAFDVTPQHFINAIITERGVFSCQQLHQLNNESHSNSI